MMTAVITVDLRHTSGTMASMKGHTDALDLHYRSKPRRNTIAHKGPTIGYRSGSKGDYWYLCRVCEHYQRKDHCRNEKGIRDAFPVFEIHNLRQHCLRKQHLQRVREARKCYGIANTLKPVIKSEQYRKEEDLKSKAKSHRCEGCGKPFASAKSLKIHIRDVHKKVQNFVCPFPCCGRRFARNFALKGHINRIHHMVD